MSKRTSFFWGLLTGAGLSTLLTLIITPSDGQHNRDIVSYQLSNLRNKLLGLWKNKEVFQNEARTEGEEHINFINQEAQRLKNEIDDIQKQLKGISRQSNQGKG